MRDFIIQVADQRIPLRPGDSILGPRNIPHTFTVTSEQPGHMLIAFTPAGQMEDFFRTAEKNPRVLLNDPAQFASHGMKMLGPPISAV